MEEVEQVSESARLQKGEACFVREFFTMPKKEGGYKMLQNETVKGMWALETYPMTLQHGQRSVLMCYFDLQLVAWFFRL